METDQLDNEELISEEIETQEDIQESDDDTLEVSPDSEEADVDADESTDEPTPEWKGRFKSEDEMWNSYRNIERVYTQTNQKFSDLERQLQEIAASKNADPARDNEEFAEAIKKNGAVHAIKSILAKEQSQAEQVRQRTEFERTYHAYMQNEEFASLEPQMTSIAAEIMPIVKGTPLENNPKLFDALFLMAKGSTVQQATKKAASQGRKKGELSALRKKQAQVERGSNSNGKDSVDLEDLSVAEMEKMFRKGQLK